MSPLWMVLVVVTAGSGIALQGAINARMGAALSSPLAAALLNFLVGTGVLAPLAIAGVGGRIQWRGFAEAPWWAYAGGGFGALLVTSVIFAVPRIGTALTYGALICGQLIAATVLDTYGWLGLERVPLNLWRMAGIGFLLVGVVLLQRGST